MIDRGVLDEDERIELLEGTLIRTSPPSRSHARVVRHLNKLLARALPAHVELRCQLPLPLARSEPQPDFAVVERRRRATRRPKTALLVIEVSLDSLDVDLAKVAIYAAAGIEEYWIVDLSRRFVEVRRSPQRTRRTYADHAVLQRGVLTSAAVPDIAVPIAPLFPTRRKDE